MSSLKTGVLYIVSTPIGNLSDLSFRALEVLKQVQFIAAEDTRHSMALMRHYGITTPMFSIHEHNEESKINYVSELLAAGNNVALISDAGTPLISDPGFKLVSELRGGGFEIFAVPGACAAIAGLSVSGLPTDRFYFEGFLPRKSGNRKQRLSELIEMTVTVICYESPHRLKDTLTDLAEFCGDSRKVCIVRELTKKFESVLLDSPQKILEHFEQYPEELKGECVLLLEASKESHQTGLGQREKQLLLSLAEHLPPKVAAGIVSGYLELPKKQIYDALLAMKL